MVFGIIMIVIGIAAIAVNLVRIIRVLGAQSESEQKDGRKKPKSVAFPIGAIIIGIILLVRGCSELFRY